MESKKIYLKNINDENVEYLQKLKKLLTKVKALLVKNNLLKIFIVLVMHMAKVRKFINL